YMRRLFLVFIIIIPSLIFSQTKESPYYRISGKIIDASTQLPVEDATIIFKSSDLNKIVFGTITNKKGKFSIDVEKGTYSATVEFISYKTKNLNISSITRDLEIGTIQLEIDTEFLDEIEIIGEKSTLEFRKNKQVFNVGKDISASGSTVTQILTNIPSVDIDTDGNLKLNGRSNVTVMINGKISTLSKSDALKSLSAGSVEKIVILNNPGASYSATTEAIINIVLKRGKNEGLNASLTGTGGYKDYYGSLLTLNHKSNNVNFFTNIQYLHRNPITLATYSNEYFENNLTTSFLNEDTTNKQPANAFISTVGFEFYLSKKSILSTSVNYTNINAENNSNTFSDILDATKNSIATNTRTNDGTFTDEIIEFVVDFEQKFNKEGQKLSAYITYSNDNEKYENTFSNTNPSFLDENFTINNTLKNTNTKITFTNPIGDNAEYEIGYEGSFGETPFKHINENATKIIDFTDTNHAFFASYGKQLKKLYYGIELRAEFLKFKIDYTYLNTVQNKEYNNLFPYVILDYSLSDYKSISLSYNKNYQLPGYGDLQPFEQKISETISYKGNEDMNPVYADNIQLTYSYFGKKITLQTSVLHSMYKDVLQLVTYQTGEQVNGLDKLITTPVNLGNLNYTAAIITAIYKPSKIIGFTANATIANFDQSGIFQIVNSANKTITQDFNHVSIDANFSLLTQLKIPNWFNFQTNIKHYLKSEGPVSTRQAYTYANVAISKDIFNKNATISITSNDIFNTNTINRTRFHTNYTTDVFVRQKYSTILASFTYRFNQHKQSRKINFGKKVKESKTKF
ncbi:TonB-dependent receptor domain-containing protein, partial [Lutibacter sp.]